MTLAEAFGIQLRKMRQDLNLSQEELAYKAEVHRTYISLLERGKKTPSLEVIFKLSRALEKSPPELITMVCEELEKSAR